jgi:hypothetical protein
LTGVAVKVTLVPGQIAPTGKAAMLTLAGNAEFTTIVTALEVAGDPVAQVAFEVITHVTTSLFARVELVNVAPVPEFIELTVH